MPSYVKVRILQWIKKNEKFLKNEKNEKFLILQIRSYFLIEKRKLNNFYLNNIKRSLAFF